MVPGSPVTQGRVTVRGISRGIATPSVFWAGGIPTPGVVGYTAVPGLTSEQRQGDAGVDASACVLE